jgi:hypothetical protein
MAPASRRRRITRWAVLWIAVFNFLVWSYYSRRPATASPATAIDFRIR